MNNTSNPCDNALLWDEFIRAVRQEVKPAVGCTEPISLALAAALAARQLAAPVERIVCRVSPNLMKNGMGVTVPGTGMVGLPIAAALGALGGDADAGLEVIKHASAEAIAAAKALLAAGQVSVGMEQPCEQVLLACARVYAGESWAEVTIADDHTRVIRVEHNGQLIFAADGVGGGHCLVDRWTL